MTEQRMYTETEMQHRVDKEVTTQRLGDIEKRISSNDQKMAVSLGEIKTQIKAVMDMIDKHSQMQVQTHKALKEEIERDFVTKSDMKVAENSFKMEMRALSVKIDSLTKRIILVVSTITCVGLVAKWLIEVIQAASRLP